MATGPDLLEMFDPVVGKRGYGNRTEAFRDGSFFVTRAKRGIQFFCRR